MAPMAPRSGGQGRGDDKIRGGYTDSIVGFTRSRCFGLFVTCSTTVGPIYRRIWFI